MKKYLHRFTLIVCFLHVTVQAENISLSLKNEDKKAALSLYSELSGEQYSGPSLDALPPVKINSLGDSKVSKASAISILAKALEINGILLHPKDQTFTATKHLDRYKGYEALLGKAPSVRLRDTLRNTSTSPKVSLSFKETGLYELLKVFSGLSKRPVIPSQDCSLFKITRDMENLSEREMILSIDGILLSHQIVLIEMEGAIFAIQYYNSNSIEQNERRKGIEPVGRLNSFRAPRFILDTAHR